MINRPQNLLITFIDGKSVANIRFKLIQEKLPFQRLVWVITATVLTGRKRSNSDNKLRLFSVYLFYFFLIKKKIKSILLVYSGVH